MAFEIINKQILATDVKRLDIVAPRIAQHVQTGQYVSVIPEEGDQSIPLTVVDSDVRKGTISVIFQEVGGKTGKLGSLPINEEVFSILGPLGQGSKIKKYGTVVCVATGIGTAQILPIARALKEAGNKVVGIIGAKTKRSLMLEAQLRLVFDKILITTDDGSYIRRGLATDVFEELIAKKKVHRVFAIGAVEMLEKVSMLTKAKNIKTRIHLNPVMVDCVGMCGACRVKVAGEERLACVEGPEFDAHEVDFKYFKIRMNAYKENGQWDSQQWQHSPERSESKTLTRLLSGILRN